MSIAAPAPPTLPAASGTADDFSAKTIVATQPLRVEKTYTTLDYKIDLQGYQTAISKLGDDPTNVKLQNSAKIYRNNIIWGEMIAIEHVYAVYHSRLFSDKNAISVASDAMTLGLTAASTMAGATGTKTILSALGTAFAGLGLSIDKNYFAQQSFQILGIAMQTRRDKVRATIATRLGFCDVQTYPLEEGQRDLVQYFGAGTLDSAVQELQEEAASAKSTATAVVNNTPPPPTTFAPPSMCPITPPPPAAQPSFNPPGGVYSKPTNVTISSTPGATIYYTTDRTGPTASSAQYTDGKPIAVTLSTEIRAIAIAPGYSTSALGLASYTIATSAAAQPLIAPDSNTTYNSLVNVVISSATPNSTIYYTLDGSTPATSETGNTKKYTGTGFTLSNSALVTAIATADGYTNSNAAQAAYKISLPFAAPPTLTPPGGTSDKAIPVTISSAIPGATVFYTTDASTPATSATGTTKQCNSPCQVQVTSSETVQAVVVANGYVASQVASATFTISAAAPRFDRQTGMTSNSPFTVNITSDTPNATIFYTKDGSTPATSVTASTQQCSSPCPIQVTSSETIKALAVASGFSVSQVVSATYSISAPAPPGVETPPPAGAIQFDPPDGTPPSASQITVKISAAPGATIFYTTDGSKPDNKVTQKTRQYDPNNPPVISKKGTTTVKAIAVINGSPIPEADATYTISSQ